MEVERSIRSAVVQTKPNNKNCIKDVRYVIELDQIKYELDEETENLKELGESL